MTARMTPLHKSLATALALLAALAPACSSGDDGSSASRSADLDAATFCRQLNQILCTKGSQCDPSFSGTVQDCTSYLDGEYCVGVSEYSCVNARGSSGECLDGVRAWNCAQFLDDSVTMDQIPSCAAMNACGGSGGSGGSGGGCDCSSYTQDCTYTYDSAGNATPHCSCSPSCCC